MENNKRILIVDDEPGVVSSLESLLGANGYSVHTASDGLQALERMKTSLPHLLITDVMMPKMDGFALYKELKKDKSKAEIPVIIISARSKMADTFLALGVETFLSKPYDTQVLLDNVGKLIGRMGSIVSTPKAEAPIPTPVQKEVVKEVPKAPTVLQAKPAIPSTKKKIIIFGKNEKVTADMCQQLEKHECFVTVIHEEGKLIPAVQEMTPDVIFLAVNADMHEPIDKIVHQVNALTLKRKAGAAPKSGDPDPASAKRQMVLYKVEEETTGVKEAGSDLVEMDNLLERCYENGAAKYIGAYSSLVFISKVDQFLK